MYSSRLPVPVIGDKVHQPSCFLLSAASFWEDISGEAIVSAAVATVDRARCSMATNSLKATLPSLQSTKVPQETLPYN